MVKDLRIRLIRDKKEFEQVLKIREQVFVKEQDVPKDMECDEYEHDSKHVIVLFKDKPIGCARIRFIDKKARLERIALLKKTNSD